MTFSRFKFFRLKNQNDYYTFIIHHTLIMQKLVLEEFAFIKLTRTIFKIFVEIVEVELKIIWSGSKNLSIIYLDRSPQKVINNIKNK